jgi:hypothetical protein
MGGLSAASQVFLRGSACAFLAEGDFFWDNRKWLFSLWCMFEIGLRTDRSREVYGGVNSGCVYSSVYSAVRTLDISTA